MWAIADWDSFCDFAVTYLVDKTQERVEAFASRFVSNALILATFMTLCALWKAYLGLKYISQQRQKPQYDRSLYANRETNMDAIEDQDFNWEEWNRVMRIRLEKYYRHSFVFCIAYAVQAAIIFAMMAEALRGLFQGTLASYAAFEFWNLFWARRHLTVRTREKYREWRRRDVTIKTMKRGTIDMEADLGNGEAMLPEDMSGSRHNTVRRAQLAQARKATVGTDSSGGSTYISRAIEADMQAGRADPDRQPQASIKRHEKAIEERTQIEYKLVKNRRFFAMPSFFRSNGGKMRRLDTSFISSARASPAPSPSA